MENLELSVSPVESYEKPEIPTLDDNNSALLKKMPSRWQKNARIIAGLGLIGALALSGGRNTASVPRNNIEHDLGHTQGSYRGYSEANLRVRLHTGGSGSSSYIVYLTEQEAHGIIRARLEAAGLVFDARPPGITFRPVPAGESVSSINWYLRNNYDGLELDLFDAVRNVGVKHVHDSNQQFMPGVQEIAAYIEELFAGQIRGIEVGAFFNPVQSVGDISFGLDPGLTFPSHQEIAETRPILEGHLINQADKFIARLQSEGILERFEDVNVTVNGAPLRLGRYPILINNHKMVPAVALFEALYMDVAVYAGPSRRTISATYDDIAIWVYIGTETFDRSSRITVTRNGDREQLRDIPVLLHNDIVLVPAQFIADLVGATVDWNEETRNLSITTRS